MNGLGDRRKKAARYMKAYRERTLAHPELTPHGTPTGYSFYGCRCPRCIHAKATYDAARKLRRTQPDA